jgi:hypothetical protein
MAIAGASQAAARVQHMGHWFKSRTRNHLQANKSLGFRFEMRI